MIQSCAMYKEWNWGCTGQECYGKTYDSRTVKFCKTNFIKNKLSPKASVCYFFIKFLFFDQLIALRKL